MNVTDFGAKFCWKSWRGQRWPANLCERSADFFLDWRSFTWTTSSVTPTFSTSSRVGPTTSWRPGRKSQSRSSSVPCLWERSGQYSIELVSTFICLFSFTKGCLSKGSLSKGSLSKGSLSKGSLSKGSLSKGSLSKGSL